MTSLPEYFENAKRAVIGDVDALRLPDLLSDDTEAVIDRVLVKRALPLIERDSSRIVKTLRGDNRIQLDYPVHDDGRLHDVLSYTPSPHVIPPLVLAYKPGWISTMAPLRDGAVDEAVDRLETKEIERRNQNIREGNTELRRVVASRYEKRRAKEMVGKEKYESILAKTKIPIVMSETGRQQLIDLTTRKKPPRPATPPAAAPAAPSKQLVLDPKDLSEIHRVIECSGLMFERTPETYKKLNEEDLRNIILSNLNSVFSEGATGETFSKSGKTDLFLKITDGGIFIAECKIWAGIEKHKNAIEQMFGYLTWRQTYGTVIEFVQTKDMTKVIQTVNAKLADSIKATWLDRKSETHLVSKHPHPDDSSRLVFVHHIFFKLSES